MKRNNRDGGQAMRLKYRESTVRRFQMTILGLLFSFLLGTAGSTATITVEHTVYASTTEAIEMPVERAIRMIPHQYQETENRIRYLYQRAESKGKDPEPMAKTIWCESGWKCVQSGIITGGVQEQSYCLAQIHAPSHPSLTYEQLNDPYFNLDFIVENYENETWYGYDRELDECTNGVSEYW